MAEIVLGMALSHGPMLSTTPEQWELRVPADKAGAHPFRGRTWTFQELIEHRRGERLNEQITLEVKRARHARCQAALDRLAGVFEQARPDVAVIFGNDQMEIFDASLIPAFAVLYGDTIVNGEPSQARLERLPPGIREATAGHVPPGGASYPAAPGLARHIIERLGAEGFDLAVMTGFPRGETPHAFGFIYRRVMKDRPIPSAPLVENTFFPPNQPSSARCRAFGAAAARAVRSWPGAGRAALFASGGLSHFVIDEDLDRRVLDALASDDAAALEAIPEAWLQSGASEIKNWIALSGAMSGSGLDFEVADYVPCYRSEAGTGTANAFVSWTQA